ELSRKLLIVETWINPHDTNLARDVLSDGCFPGCRLATWRLLCGRLFERSLPCGLLACWWRTNGRLSRGCFPLGIDLKLRGRWIPLRILIIVPLGWNLLVRGLLVVHRADARVGRLSIGWNQALRLCSAGTGILLVLRGIRHHH